MSAFVGALSIATLLFAGGLLSLVLVVGVWAFYNLRHYRRRRLRLDQRSAEPVRDVAHDPAPGLTSSHTIYVLPGKARVLSRSDLLLMAERHFSCFSVERDEASDGLRLDTELGQDVTEQLEAFLAELIALRRVTSGSESVAS